MKWHSLLVGLQKLISFFLHSEMIQISAICGCNDKGMGWALLQSSPELGWKLGSLYCNAKYWKIGQVDNQWTPIQ